MGTNQPNKPQTDGKPTNSPAPRRVDDRTIELTEAEIKSFGSKGGSEVRAGNKGANKPDSKSK